jgi:hypothetical protein
VALVRAAPVPQRLDDGSGFSPTEATAKLGALGPALSGPSAEEVWAAALEQARLFGAPGGRSAGLVLSVRARRHRGAPAGPSPPWGEGGHERQRAPGEGANQGAPKAIPSLARVGGEPLWRTVGPGIPLDNVALTAFGSATRADGHADILVQVRSFALGPRRGEVHLRLRAAGGPPLEPRAVSLGPGEATGVGFTILSAVPLSKGGERWPALEVVWKDESGPDALPEDDALTAAPLAHGVSPGLAPPRLRWHHPAPHLEELYRLALDSVKVTPEEPGPADLEIYVDAVPAAVPPSSRALMLLAPARDFGPFEVLSELLPRPIARLGEEDPLTRNLQDRPEGLDFPIAQARWLRQVGEWRVLIQDGAGHPLAARFRLPDGRPGYVLAFVPGEGLNWAPGRKFDSPALAALLVRMVREACGALEPYIVRTAAELERAAGEPLPPDWKPGFDPHTGAGQGVLDATVSRLELGPPTEGSLDLAALIPAPRPKTLSFWPILALAAMLLLLAEVWLEQRARTMSSPP